MQKRRVFAEAILLLVVLQGLLIAVKSVALRYFPEFSFAQRMTTMVAMAVLCIAVIGYAKWRRTSLSVFPQRLNKCYVISTVVAAVILVATPSNFTGGYTAILLLVYGSIVTPIFEELIFRGYLWNRLNGVLSKETYTYAWSVALFTVWHIGYMLPQIAAGNWGAVLMKLAAGLGYGVAVGYVRLKCKNCYICMLVHGVLNTVMI